MKAFDIYKKTAEFRRMKLLLGLGMTLLAVVLYAAMVALPLLASKVLSYIMLPFWAALSVFLCNKIYRAVGWRIDAGHIGIITGAITEGYIPTESVSLASDMVDQRFRSKNHYFQAKKRIKRAVVELNTVFSRASSLVGDVPGMKMMMELVRLCLRLHLTFMTRCVLAYTFFRGDEGLYVSAAKGSAVYALNWKRLVKKNSDIVTFCIAGAVVLLTIIFSFVFCPLLGLLMADPEAAAEGAAAVGIDIRYFGVILAFLLTLVLKNAYLDSWFTVYYIHLYMHLAEYSTPGGDFYVRLSAESPAFGQLMALADGKMPTPKKSHTFASSERRRIKKEAMANRRQPDAQHPLICPRCKNANRKDARFCASCGARIQ